MATQGPRGDAFVTVSLPIEDLIRPAPLLESVHLFHFREKIECLGYIRRVENIAMLELKSNWRARVSGV